MSPGPRSATHHDRILQSLKGRILDGTWPPGFQIPFEVDLALAHDVSRMTMNKVLTQLTREGFLTRRRKLGTFVASPRAQSAVMEITDPEAEVRRLGLGYRFDLVDREIRMTRPGELDAVPECNRAPQEVVALRGVHLAADMAFCIETRLISLAAAPAARDQDFAVQIPGQWLFRQVPWSVAEHRIRAVGATRAEGVLLDLRAGAPCLEVVRRTESGRQWVTQVRLVYPGRRHQLLAQFGPRTDEA